MFRSATIVRGPSLKLFRLRFSKKNYVVIWYAVVCQRVIGMVCVLCAVLSVSRSQHSAQYTYHTYDTLPHHRITYNDVVFTES